MNNCELVARAIGPASSWRSLDVLTGFFREGVGATEHQETYGFMWRAGVRTAEEARTWLMEKDGTSLGWGLQDSLSAASRVISVLSPYLCHGVGCSANDLDQLDHSPCTCGLRKFYNPKGLSDTPPETNTTGDQHPDDIAVDRFAAAMKAKLAKKRAEGRGGWDNPAECSIAFLSTLLRTHIAKGDPVDVGNFAMMIHQRGGTVE